MTTEQILQIAAYVVAGLSILFNIAQLVYSKITGKKSKFASTALNFIDEISTTLEFAEQMTRLTKEEKKNFAKNAVLQYCENKKLKFSDEQVDDATERLIKLTKKVNAREKDMIAGGGDAPSEADEEPQNEEII